MTQVTLGDMPVTSIKKKSLASNCFNLYEADMLKASLFQTKRLTAGTSTNFY